MTPEVVWNGATWRAFPQPLTPVLQAEVSALGRAHDAATFKARLISVLTSEMQSRGAIRDRAGMSPNSVQIYLAQLVAEGLVDQHIIPARVNRGRAQHFFRLAAR